MIEHLPGKRNLADGPSRRPDYEDDESKGEDKPLKSFLRFALTLNITRPPILRGIKEATVEAI